MNQEQYINHEVQIRLLKELNDERFIIHCKKLERLEERMDSKFNIMEERMDSKFNIMIGIVISSVLLPIVFHFLKLM